MYYHQLLIEQFTNTKYLRWYISIIDAALSRGTVKPKITANNFVYYEAHHILPKCVFPQYSNFSKFPWNKVLLTAKEHFICHLLLAKASNNTKLWHAAYLMFKNSNHTTSVLYEKSKLQMAINRRQYLMSTNNTFSFKGRKHSLESKLKASVACKKKLTDIKGRKVYQFDITGNLLKVFDSISDAAKYVNTSGSNIKCVCDHKFTHSKGFIWEWVNFTNRRITLRS